MIPPLNLYAFGLIGVTFSFMSFKNLSYTNQLFYNKFEFCWGAEKIVLACTCYLDVWKTNTVSKFMQKLIHVLIWVPGCRKAHINL